MNKRKLTLPIIIAIAVVLLSGIGIVGALNGFFGGGGSIPSDTFTRGLVGYWGFDEGSGTTAYDGSGNSNTGTLTNGPKWASGKVGGAVQFDGVDDYVNFSSIVTDPQNDFTVMGWAKILSGVGSNSKVFCWGNITNDAPFVCLDDGQGGGILRFVIRNDASAAFSALSNNVGFETGVWHYLVGVRNGNTLTAYVDGQPGTPTTDTIGAVTTNRNAIGRITRLNSTAYFNGLIDEVRIYNRALTDAEVKFHYNRGGPVGQWTFDEGNGKVAFDSSGNNNSGHLHGPALNFDGGDYVNVVSASSLNPTSAISISAWIKASTVSGTDQIVAKFGTGGGDRQYALELDGGILGMFIRKSDDSNWVSAVDTVAVSTGSWYHAVGTFDGSYVRVYKNGILVGTSTQYTGTINSGTGQPVHTGGFSGNYFDGIIDEARIYNRALSATEILEHFRGKYTDNSGTVGLWHFDENTGYTAYDSSSNGNNGTLGDGVCTAGTCPAWVNYAPTWTTGKNGTALSFDGVDDYVSITSSASFAFGTGDFTWSLWTYPTAFGSEYNMFVGFGSLNPYFAIRIVGATKYLHFYMGGTFEVVYPFVANTWYYVTVRRTSGVVELYINGIKLSGSGNLADSISQQAGAIGRWGTNSSYYFNGSIDDVRIYNYARTPDEIALDYNAGFAAHFGPSSSCDEDPGACMDYGLVGNWAMDEGSGTTAYDKSDYANNGTLTNGPKWATGIKPLSGGASGGGALSFDGVDDYVDAGSAASLNLTNAISVELWVNPITLKADSYIAAHGTYQSKGWVIYGTSAEVDIWMANAGGGVYGIASPVLAVNQWTNIAFTYDGINLRTYINSVLKDIDALTAPIDYGTKTKTLFAFQESGNAARYFNGLIDDVRIYNRALTATEIRYHYNRGGPVAYWKFDEGEGDTAYDESNNNNDGNLAGTCPGGSTCPTWVAGKYGSALSFDGTDEYVSVPDSVSLGITNALTISAWVKTTVEGEYGRYVGINGGYDLGYESTDETKVRWEQNGVAPSTVLNSASGAVPKNVWNHVVGTYDKDAGANNRKIYVNGIKIAEDTATGAMSDPSAPVGIGALGNNTQFFGGLIDDVRIYNYARTTEQIYQDYNAGLSTHFK